MGMMSPMSFVTWRCYCGLHTHKRAQERGIALTHQQIEQLSARINRMRPAFERPGQDRYRLRVRLGTGKKVRLVFDTKLSTIVTVLGRVQKSISIDSSRKKCR
tara:strand:- start:26292 stop:26600 length:309 start_codon:yes stop_codon:yes gene_type:complete